MQQLALFQALARCQDCGREVPHVQRVRRFWVCDACRVAIVPAEGDVVAVGRYWGWAAEMDRRYPVPVSVRTGRRVIAREVGDYWPVCECGAERVESSFRDPSAQMSLFGRPRAGKCPRCEARAAVETVIGMAEAIHPGWDDEEWLDLLWKSHRVAFELGVLPGLWFELRRKREAR